MTGMSYRTLQLFTIFFPDAFSILKLQNLNDRNELPYSAAVHSPLSTGSSAKNLTGWSRSITAIGGSSKTPASAAAKSGELLR